MSATLCASQLHKSFQDERVVHDVSLSVDQGEIVSILGPSGCGKTTLLRMLAGLEQPDAGQITLDEQVVYRDRPFAWTPPERRGIGMVFQDFGLWPHLTVHENVAYPLRYGRRTRLAASRRDVDVLVSDALEGLGIGPLRDKLPHHLSGGQQQRVAFARATVARPRLLLLDEPFSALDRQLRVQLREELLAMLREARFTVVHVTHDQEEALAISDRILVMSRGRSLQYDTPENLYHRPQGMAVAAFVGRSNLIPVQVETVSESAIRVSLPDGQSFDLDRSSHEPLPPCVQRTPMMALVRPEEISLVERPAAGALHLTGTVDGTQFLGDRYMVHVSVPRIGPMLCYTPRKVAAGTRALLYAPLPSVHLLPSGEDAYTTGSLRYGGKAGV